MAGPILYSTNVWLKYLICQKFRHDIHYIWCSENFDSQKASGYTSSSLIPPSSNPADIYRQLQSDAKRGDRHSPKIQEQKACLSHLAVEWEINGDILPEEKEEILYMIDIPGFDYWRPLVYVIPRAAVSDRMKLVPINRRAGIGDEYIVEEIKSDEFDIIEL